MKTYQKFINEARIILGKSFNSQTDEYVKRLRDMGQKSRDGVRIAGAYVNVTPFANTVVINEISLPYTRQGKGAGHKVMKILTDLADELGVRLQLFAKPIDQGPDKEKITQKKLTAFYKKHGFTGIGRMIREPK